MSAADPAFLQDLFADLGPIRIRRMFGGLGVYADDAMFALVADDALYMKTDDELSRTYAAAGSQPFIYESGGRRVETSYWRLPDGALDDAEIALDWARRSLGPARAAAAKRTRKSLHR